MERSWKSLLFLTLLIASTQGSTADIGSFFNSLGNTLKDAGNTVKDGTETAFQVVKNTTVDAANATGTLCLSLHLLCTLHKMTPVAFGECVLLMKSMHVIVHCHTFLLVKVMT